MHSTKLWMSTEKVNGSQREESDCRTTVWGTSIEMLVLKESNLSPEAVYATKTARPRSLGLAGDGLYSS